MCRDDPAADDAATKRPSDAGAPDPPRKRASRGKASPRAPPRVPRFTRPQNVRMAPQRQKNRPARETRRAMEDHEIAASSTPSAHARRLRPLSITAPPRPSNASVAGSGMTPVVTNPNPAVGSSLIRSASNWEPPPPPRRKPMEIR